MIWVLVVWSPMLVIVVFGIKSELWAKEKVGPNPRARCKLRRQERGLSAGHRLQRASAHLLKDHRGLTGQTLHSPIKYFIGGIHVKKLVSHHQTAFGHSCCYRNPSRSRL
ncbi:hypothetical protein ACFX2A_041315 [Malus domestica]